MFIKDVEIKGKVVLAPMAGVSDRAFRQICREFGAALVYSEMASSKGLIMENEKTKEIMSVTNQERPIAIQLFGEDKEVLKKAAYQVQELFNPDIIDINFGCPANKIAGNGDGAALMKEPEKAGRIVEAVKSVSSAPVTVKFRLGWDEKSINALEFGRLMESSGADALAVHGRTREQQYTGMARYTEIKELKKSVRIPVIANGDIVDGVSALKVLEETGADLLMVGRGAYGNPWIFPEIENAILKKPPLKKPSLEEKMAVMLIHIELLCRFKGEKVGMKQARKHSSWYIKGLKNSAHFRKKLSDLETFLDLKRITEEILDKNKAF